MAAYNTARLKYTAVKQSQGWEEMAEQTTTRQRKRGNIYALDDERTPSQHTINEAWQNDVDGLTQYRDKQATPNHWEQTDRNAQCFKCNGTGHLAQENQQTQNYGTLQQREIPKRGPREPQGNMTQRQRRDPTPRWNSVQRVTNRNRQYQPDMRGAQRTWDTNDTANMRQASEVTCFRCQEQGHYANECPAPQPARRKMPICFTCQEEGHFAANCPSQPRQPRHTGMPYNRPTCQKCNRTGHATEQCRSWPISQSKTDAWQLCHNCEQPGHYASACPNQSQTRMTGDRINAITVRKQGPKGVGLENDSFANREATVNGIPRKIMIDTGASVSCCSLKTYKSLKEVGLLNGELEHIDVNINGLGGQKMKCFGGIALTTIMEDVEFTHEYMVVDMAPELIAGRDIMAQHFKQVNINFAQNTLTIGSQETKILEALPNIGGIPLIEKEGQKYDSYPNIATEIQLTKTLKETNFTLADAEGDATNVNLGQAKEAYCLEDSRSEPSPDPFPKQIQETLEDHRIPPKRVRRRK